LPNRAEAIGVGIAGGTEKTSLSKLEKKLQKDFPDQKILLTSDLETVLACGENRQEATVGLISGTGSIAFAKSKEGQLLRTGGWGYLLDDPGSGYWIGKQLLAYYFAQVDTADRSDDATRFLQKIQNCLQLSSPQDVKDWLYEKGQGEGPNSKIASLACRAFEQFEGDFVVDQTLTQAANKLAVSVLNTRNKLCPEMSRDYELVVGGSLLTKRPSFLQRVLKELASLEETPRKVTLVTRPAEGALRIAANFLDR